MVTLSSFSSDYAHHWYTWLIVAIVFIICVTPVYFKVIKPSCAKKNDRNTIRNNNHEYQSIPTPKKPIIITGYSTNEDNITGYYDDNDNFIPSGKYRNTKSYINNNNNNNDKNDKNKSWFSKLFFDKKKELFDEKDINYGTERENNKKSPVFGHYCESTDMIPDTPNGYANLGYSYLHQSLKTFRTSFMNHVSNHIFQQTNDTNNDTNNNKSEIEKSEKSENSDIFNSTQIRTKKNTIGISTYQYNPKTNNNNENNVSIIKEIIKIKNPSNYESLHKMPFQWADNQITNNNSDNANTNNMQTTNKLYHVSIEDHSPKKIPFVVANHNLKKHIYNNYYNNNNSDSNSNNITYNDDDNDNSEQLTNTDESTELSDVLQSDQYDYQTSIDSYDEPDQYL